MRQCYEELGRAPSTPLASVEEAFRPCDDLIVYEKYNHQWSGWEFNFPRNSLSPGVESQPGFQFWHIAFAALTWLRDHWHAYEAAERARKAGPVLSGQDDRSRDHFSTGSARQYKIWLTT